MLFNSIEFPLFLAITYIGYRILPFRGQNLLLLIASYIFYGWWDERFLFLIVLSTTIDFCCGLMIDKGRLTLWERCLPSVYLILANIFFITLNWENVIFNPYSLTFSKGWSEIFVDSLSGWAVFLTLLVLIILANLAYFPLSRLAKNKQKKIFLTVSILANLGILGIFKYFNFFVDSAESIFANVGIQANISSLNIILPVGISFYTFQTMSYTIDIYRGELKATDRFLDFALFVSFFPQLVAGPIERASELLPRILAPRELSFKQSTRGLYLILFGLFKKIAIADSIAKSVNSIYEISGQQVSWLDVVLATFLFAIQIYCDFSGYSDIARGVSKLFGIELMCNFNLPYFSRNPSEFWQRWHISLSSWLRDYLYIPLGGNRRGNVYRNLMITMVLGGLWHGAGWNFVLWGFYQGTLLCIYRFGKKAFSSIRLLPSSWSTVNPLITTVIFFIFTCYGWLLFRANSFEQIASFTQILFTDIGNFSISISKPTLAGVFGLPLLFIYELIEYNNQSATFYLKIPAIVRGIFYALLTTIMIMGMSNEPEQFIYFQF